MSLDHNEAEALTSIVTSTKMGIAKHSRINDGTSLDRGGEIGSIRDRKPRHASQQGSYVPEDTTRSLATADPGPLAQGGMPLDSKHLDP